MNLKCYGWYLDQNNEIKANLPFNYHLISRVKNDVICTRNCRICLFDLENLTINCPGLRDDGDFRFMFTTRMAQKTENIITCNLLPDEGKCPDCLLKLRRIPGR